MQGWIMDVAQDLRRSNGDVGRWGPKYRGGGSTDVGGSSWQEEGSVRFRVVDVGGEEKARPGVTLLRGLVLDGHVRGEERVASEAGSFTGIALVGSGGGKGSDSVRVHEGDVVALMPPHWEIELDGQSWRVGIEWQKTQC